MFQILITDDEEEIVELIEVYLVEAGYKVFKAYDGAQALDFLEKEKIDLMILDIMMPGLNGLKVCEKARQHYKVPIIIVSAKGQEQDKIAGLGGGADDYMVKPFAPLELVARVASQLRRATYFNTYYKEPEQEVIEIKGLKIDKKQHQVSLFNQSIKLTPIEYEILLLLAEHRGKVYSSEEIYRTLWKEKYFEGNNTVMAHMWRLREKIEENPKAPERIKTVWGVGYQIEKDES